MSHNKALTRSLAPPLHSKYLLQDADIELYPFQSESGAKMRLAICISLATIFLYVLVVNFRDMLTYAAAHRQHSQDYVSYIEQFIKPARQYLPTTGEVYFLDQWPQRGSVAMEARRYIAQYTLAPLVVRPEIHPGPKGIPVVVFQQNRITIHCVESRHE